MFFSLTKKYMSFVGLPKYYCAQQLTFFRATESSKDGMLANLWSIQGTELFSMKNMPFDIVQYRL